MVGNLALLHRYTLVRTHVKIGDHHQAAKLLIQVAANISRFPARKSTAKLLEIIYFFSFAKFWNWMMNEGFCLLYRTDTVPILTSTVIECHRVGFQKAAFSYASMLMRSENRSQIDQKYAKKIEAIVRKAPNGIKDAEDSYQNETRACPICDCNLQIMELSCHQCKTNLPMCIATVKSHWKRKSKVLIIQFVIYYFRVSILRKKMLLLALLAISFALKHRWPSTHFLSSEIRVILNQIFHIFTGFWMQPISAQCVAKLLIQINWMMWLIFRNI